MARGVGLGAGPYLVRYISTLCACMCESLMIRRIEELYPLVRHFIIILVRGMLS